MIQTKDCNEYRNVAGFGNTPVCSFGNASYRRVQATSSVPRVSFLRTYAPTPVWLKRAKYRYTHTLPVSYQSPDVIASGEAWGSTVSLPFHIFAH